MNLVLLQTIAPFRKGSSIRSILFCISSILSWSIGSCCQRVDFRFILYQKVSLFFLKRYTKVFCYTLYVTFGNIPPLSLVEKAVFHVFPVVDKRFQFFVCILYFVKYWRLTSSTKDLFCLSLYFSKTNLSCGDLITCWVQCQVGC